MKARLYPVVLSLAWACAISPSRVQAAAEPSSAFVDPADPAAAAYRQQGERVIDQVGGSLISELHKVLSSMPTALALGSVHLKNYRPPSSPRGKPPVITVRRTSLQVRNPANAPDAADRAALERIQAAVDGGEPIPPVLIQKIEAPGQPVEWRVYRPLAVLKDCIDCHGPKRSIAPDVLATLSKLYPDDKAVDYPAGAWRGVIRVSLADPKRKP